MYNKRYYSIEKYFTLPKRFYKIQKKKSLLMVCFSNYLHLYDGVIREVQIVKTTKFLRNKFYGMYMQTTMS